MRISLGLGLFLALPFLACEDVEEADGGLPDLGINLNDTGPVDVGAFDLGVFDVGPLDLGTNDDAGTQADATFDDATFDDATFPDADLPDTGPPDTGCSDLDNDTVCDFEDVCAAGDDRVDTDGDAVPDACDVCPLDSPDDPDGDGVCTTNDICVGGDDTADQDADTVPDFCDVCSDGDDLLDTDLDLVPDACDPCPVDSPDDPDGDGVCTVVDACLLGNDLLDFDGDTVPDACDNCADTANPLQEDTRGVAAYPIPFAPISVASSTNAPTVYALGDDDFTGVLPIGFPIFFFGDVVTQVVVVSNGFLSFEPNLDSAGCCVGGGIPYNDLYNGIVAVAWTDLYPPAGGQIRTFTVGAAPNRRFVVEYFEVPLISNSSTVTAQAVLFEGSDHLEIHTTRQPLGQTYTRGIESLTGTVAAYIRDERNRDFELIDDGEGFDTDLPGPDGIGDACDGYDDVQFAGSGSGSGSGVIVE